MKPICTLFILIAGLEFGCVSLSAQWVRIACPKWGTSRQIWTVAVVDDWMVIADGTSKIWRTQTPELLGSLQEVPVLIQGESVEMDDLVEHRGRLYARASRGFVVSDDAGLTWAVPEPAWPMDCTDLPFGDKMGLISYEDALYAWCELSGPWRTTDGGVTWKDMTIDLEGPNSPPITSVAVGKSYTAVLSRLYGGHPVLLITTDHGDTWITRDPPALEFQGQFEFVQLSIGTQDVLYANGRVYDQEHTYRTYRSTDRGATWERITIFDGRYMSICAVKDVDICTDPVRRSDDGGQSWTPFDDGLTPGNIWTVKRVGQHVVAVATEELFRIRMDHVTTVGTIQESVSGALCAVRDPRFVRGSVPYTTIRVERDAGLDAYNVLGECVGTWRLEAGEHTLFTPEPSLLVQRR